MLTLTAESPAGRRRLRIDRSRPLGRGGAGTVYGDLDRQDFVVKLYHPGQAAGNEARIKAMIDAAPGNQEIAYGNRNWVQIVWPKEVVRDAGGAFLGFVMQAVDFHGSTDLEAALQKASRADENLPEQYRFRLYAARNAAAVVYELHRCDHRVIDMKPANMRVYRDNGFIALLDTDGCDIKGPQGRFPAPLGTGMYMCPEGHAKGGKASQLGEEQDLFALAVIIFQLLNNGIHPFQGRPKTENCPTSVEERIAQRLYPYPDNQLQSANPRTLLPWLEDETVEMFHRAFSGKGRRPTARDWREHLDKLVKGLQECPNNHDHQHFSKGCGLCALAGRNQPQPALPVKQPSTQIAGNFSRGQSKPSSGTTAAIPTPIPPQPPFQAAPQAISLPQPAKRQGIFPSLVLGLAVGLALTAGLLPFGLLAKAGSILGLEWGLASDAAFIATLLIVLTACLRGPLRQTTRLWKRWAAALIAMLITAGAFLALLPPTSDEAIAAKGGNAQKTEQLRPKETARANDSAEKLRRLQGVLRDLGYLNGTASGQTDSQTRKAASLFLKHLGSPAADPLADDKIEWMTTIGRERLRRSAGGPAWLAVKPAEWVEIQKALGLARTLLGSRVAWTGEGSQNILRLTSLASQKNNCWFADLIVAGQSYDGLACQGANGVWSLTPH